MPTLLPADEARLGDARFEDWLNQRAPEGANATGIGNNLPQEGPQAFAHAVIDVDGYTR